ncbi:MAG: hypothetical protein R3E79_24115 [Caldilineaceae bacterium]
MRKLRQSELLIADWSPVLLKMELDAYLWRDEPHLQPQKSSGSIWSRYCYLSRLYDQHVLIAAIQAGLQHQERPFAYADRMDESGRYHGLTLGAPATIYFNEESLLVRPAIAQAQFAADEAAKAARTPTGPTIPITVTPSPGHAVKETGLTLDPPVDPPTVAALMRRYYGSVNVDPKRVNKELGLIVEEIIERLTSLPGAEVELTLEIKARRPAGFEESTVRTVTENSRTLKFRDASFEPE